MKFLLVLGFVAMACATSVLPQGENKLAEYLNNMSDSEGDIEFSYDPEEGTVEVAPQFIVSWQLRRFIRKMQKQMPCGWPQYGIPPLAPLKKREANIHFQKGNLETITSFFKFLVEGLDSFKLNTFNINMIFKRIKFDITFKNIRTTAEKYSTNTIIDFIRELGLSVEYEGDGKLDFGCKDMRVSGVLYYKMPLLWGSMKITSLKTKYSLESCESNITGFMGNGKINRMINDNLASLTVSTFNENSDYMSNYVEQEIVPEINKQLKGKDFWTLIDLIFSSNEGESENDPIRTKCKKPKDPWA